VIEAENRPWNLLKTCSLYKAIKAKNIFFCVNSSRLSVGFLLTIKMFQWRSPGTFCRAATVMELLIILRRYQLLLENRQTDAVNPNQKHQCEMQQFSFDEAKLSSLDHHLHLKQSIAKIRSGCDNKVKFLRELN
jgi:hypothetical protein